MNNPKLKEADLLMKQGLGLIERGKELMQKAAKMYDEESVKALRKKEDKFINKKQALELLWFSSYQNLLDWEKRVNPMGYLEFADGKILRSEILRFIDDYSNGTIQRKLRRLQ